MCRRGLGKIVSQSLFHRSTAIRKHLQAEDTVHINKLLLRQVVLSNELGPLEVLISIDSSYPAAIRTAFFTSSLFAHSTVLNLRLVTPFGP